MTVEDLTVKDLIEYLQRMPQDLPVAYRIYSEWALLETKEISIQDLGKPRLDGWVPSPRPDRPTRSYLVFPGN